MGANSPPPSDSTNSVLQQYQQYLPSSVLQLNRQLPGTADATLQAINRMYGNTGPVEGLNDLNTRQLEAYGMRDARAGQRINASNAAATAALEQRYNPAYRGANKLIDAIDTHGLSPGEASAIERSTNQTNSATGNLGLINPTNTINNAINFGGAFNNKLSLLGNAVGAASGAGFNPLPGVTGSNFGTSQFGSANPNSAAGAQNNVFGFGSSLLGNTTSSNNSLTSANASMANANAPSSYLGAICCFIFLESQGYGKIPKYVRRGRDKYYSKNHFIAVGYRRMARWLVPAMRDNIFIKQLTYRIMVGPITNHLQHPKKGWNKTITHFWLRLWAILGKGKCEADYCDLVDYLGSYV